MRLVFDAAPGPAIVVGLADLGDRFRLVANEIDVVAAAGAAAPAPGRPGGLAAAARTGAPPPRAGSPPAARTTPCCPAPVDTEHLTDLADMLGVELLIIDADTTVAPVRATKSAGTRPTTGSPRASEPPLHTLPTTRERPSTATARRGNTA